jgi:hypothetical protein
MNPRQQAYLDLLTHGLAAVRNLAEAGLTDLCGVEADHLHNIPSLLEESNEHRHHYYLVAERAGYLAQLRRLGAAEYLEQMAIWYGQSWRTLASVAGVALAE